MSSRAMFARFASLMALVWSTSTGCIPVDNADLPIDIEWLDSDDDGYPPAAGDCDDHDPARHPEVTELCNDEDDDCDGKVDEAFDTDGDGISTCQYVNAPVDCDDGNADFYPGATEICDAFDNDCDGQIDEDLDADGDGVSHCDKNGGVADCNDDDDTIFPGNTNILCDGLDNDCDDDSDEGFDADSDGVAQCALGEMPADCDDENDAVAPGLDEQCDGLDNDCDGAIDEGFDGDGDGYFACASVDVDGHALEADCDDDLSELHPGATERCDGQDNDCDGQVDDADDDVEGLTTFYVDADLDGYGDEAQTQSACFLAEGLSENGLDCDDGQDWIHPGADELCSAGDEDCDGHIDEGLDVDGDGFVPCASVDGNGEALSADCDDSRADIYPGAQEVCSPEGEAPADEDCDGLIDSQDDGVVGTAEYYQDSDGDGYGESDTLIQACGLDDGAADIPGDCDDADAQAYPGAEEICSASDSDCDGLIDEGLDGDGDGFLPCASVDADGEPLAADCDDGNPAIHPQAQEICSDDEIPVDEDCDGLIDGEDDSIENAETFYADTDGDGYGDENTPILACALAEGLSENALDCDDSDPAIHPETPWYLDGDGDGFGDEAQVVVQCEAPGDDYVRNLDDCDDANAAYHPDALEICDDADGDCDGAVDEGLDIDGDGDGYQGCGVEPERIDCNDAHDAIHPDAEDTCNGIDDNCDGTVDELFDVDGDGYTLCGELIDCDDTNAEIHPEALDLCENGDEDCDGLVDEASDLDGDGYFACESAGENFDCDDESADVFPGQVETCNGVDNDCSGGSGDYYVTKSGDAAADFSSIQLAINHAGDESCVIGVGPGTYIERIEFGGAAVTLRSEAGAENTIITANQVDSVIRFNHGEGADSVIDGFTLTGGIGNSDDLGYPMGGAVLFGPGVSATVKNSILHSNKAEVGAAVACYQCADAVLDNNLIYDNSAYSRAGPLGIDFNGVGGAIFVTEGMLSSSNNSLFENKADLFGGAIYISDSSVFSSDNDLIRENEADPTATYSTGGGLYITEGSEVQMINSVVNENLAYQGGGIALLDGGRFVGNGVEISENQATLFHAEGLEGYGGGVLLLDGTTAIFRDATLNQNRGVRGGAIVSFFGSTVFIERSTFNGNQAVGVPTSDFNGLGGAIYTSSGDGGDWSGLTITDSLFVANQAGPTSQGYGGAIFVGKSDTAIKRSVFEDNFASWAGGALQLQEGFLSVQNSIFAGNESPLAAAMTLIEAASLTVVNNTVDGNLSTFDAEEHGGGVLLFQDTGGVIYNNIIANNHSTQGALLYIESEVAYDNAMLQYNDFYGNVGGNHDGAMSDPVGQNGNIEADPLYAEEIRSAFTLGLSSTLIDAGHPSAAYTDADGSRNDIGAYGGPGGDWSYGSVGAP